MNPNVLGVIGPGFLNRVPTLRRFGAWGLGFLGALGCGCGLGFVAGV